MITNQACKTAEDYAKSRPEGADYCAFDHENSHDASACGTHGVENCNMSAALDDNKKKRRRDVECSHRNDQSDYEKTHATLQRQGRKERAIGFLPIHCGVGTAQGRAHFSGALLDGVNVPYLDTNDRRRMLTAGKFCGNIQREIDPG